jgi:hypothetical protein
MIKVKPKVCFDYYYNNKKYLLTPQQTWLAFINPAKISLEVNLVYEEYAITLPVTVYYEKFRRVKEDVQDNNKFQKQRAL